MKKLNILQIINLTLQEIKLKRFEFIRFGSLLFLLPFILWLANELQIDVWNPATFNYNPFIFLIYLIFLIVFSIVMVGCHRVFLMNDDDIGNTATIRLGVREWNFMAWWIKLGLIMAVLFIPTMLLIIPFYVNIESEPNDWVFLVITIPMIYILSRLSLVFPATAVQNTNTSLAKTWKLSSGNGWRLTLLIGLIPFLTSFFLELLPIADSIYYYIVSSIAWLAVGLFELGLLSMSYAYLSGYIDDEG
ncbi:MAG: hypothetical protein L3J83_05900 [Proteobacteria bacterium]|nr:hypothetical protein [Pseudomonadota bacterium]